MGFLILLNSIILVSSESIITFQKCLFLHTSLCDSSFFLLRKNEGNSENKSHQDIQKSFLLIMPIIMLITSLNVFFTAR